MKVPVRLREKKEVDLMELNSKLALLSLQVIELDKLVGKMLHTINQVIKELTVMGEVDDGC